MKVKRYIFFKYALFALLIFLLFKCTLNGSSTHFALAFMWALVWCNQNIYILTPLLVAMAIGAMLPFYTVAAFAGAALILCFAFYTHTRLKKRLNFFTLNVYLLASQLPFFLLVSSDTSLVAKLCISIALTQIFFNAVVNFLQPLLIRRVMKKFGTDELISLAVLLAMLASGLSQINIVNINIGALAIYFCILFATFAFKNFAGVTTACIFGIGYLIAGDGSQMLTMFVCFSLVAYSFCKVGKIYTLSACIMLSACLVFFFKIVDGNPYINTSIPTLACILFLLVPTSYLKTVQDVFVPQAKSAQQQLAFYSKTAIQKRLASASDCFMAIERVFKKNVKQTVNVDEAKKVLKAELVSGVCQGCQKFRFCHNAPDVPATLEKVINNSLIRGKATILDIPPALTAKCGNIGEIISSSNELAVKYLKFNALQKNKSVGTEIVCEQMKELSRAVMALSGSMTTKQIFNINLAAQIETALVFANLPITQVICEENADGTLVITTSFKKGVYIDERRLEALVSKTAKHKYAIVQTSDLASDIAEACYVFEACPPYDVVFGLACAPKTGSKISGDTHSFIKMRGGKILLALCDGMGSGASANKISEEAIELTETFYRAGFDSSFILESVNKLLSLGGGEEFVAMDICVLDLFSSGAKFFKLASPESLLAGEKGVDIIEGGALPIGVGGDIDAKIEGRVITAGDMLVLVTDGVRDAFENLNEL
ncbi:MAG: SpoIIE family protein phosphatase, partial [Firmicutes bacterium]|nr:SpoIIE family protein phosphatase [Bacillota bacterium]